MTDYTLITKKEFQDRIVELIIHQHSLMIHYEKLIEDPKLQAGPEFVKYMQDLFGDPDVNEEDILNSHLERYDHVADQKVKNRKIWLQSVYEGTACIFLLSDDGTPCILSATPREVLEAYGKLDEETNGMMYV